MTSDRPPTVDTGYSAHLATIATAAATSVGEVLRAAFRNHPEVRYKRDLRDPVTDYDHAAEERIRDVLFLHEPDSRVVGEEGGATGGGSVHWYVDPIDGTCNFVHGLPYFCTSVAAVVGGQVVAGAIFDPLRGDLFAASLRGVWCNGHPVRSAGARSEQEAMLLFGPGPEIAGLAPELVAAFQAVRITGSAALNLAHIAAGWSDMYVAAGVAPWDVAAGALMVAAAGGQFVGLHPPGDTGDGPAWAAPGCLAAVGTLELIGSTVATTLGWRATAWTG